MRSSRIQGVLAAVFFGIIAGCGGTAKDAPKTIAVTGTVNFKGQPLAGAMVVFCADVSRASGRYRHDGF